MATTVRKAAPPVGPFRFGEETADTLDGACELVKSFCDNELEAERGCEYIHGADGRLYRYELLVVLDGPALIECPDCKSEHPAIRTCKTCNGHGLIPEPLT